MIRKIVKVATQWIVASFLLFTQIQLQAGGYSSTCETNECCDDFWAEADYLYWKIQNSPEYVPLVITGPTLAVPSPVLGSPDTTVVLGGKKIDTGWRSEVESLLVIG